MAPVKCQHLKKSFADVKLAINHDIFRYGILKNHQKLQNANLRRMITYCLKKQTSKSDKDNKSSNADGSSVNSANPALAAASTISSTQSLNEDLCYPILSWQSWRYIAVNKLQITETLAWAYFDTFLALNFERNPAKRKSNCENKLRFLSYENPLGGDTFSKYDKQSLSNNHSHNHNGSSTESALPGTLRYPSVPFEFYEKNFGPIFKIEKIKC